MGRIRIPLVMELAALALLMGCGSEHREEAKRCIDRTRPGTAPGASQSWAVVPEDRCSPEAEERYRRSFGGSTVYPYPYQWYYGGHGYYPGGYATGGATAPTQGYRSVTPSTPGFSQSPASGASSRGGFGSAGGAHSSSGGGGGGG